jgi:hypothetical protein
MSDTSDGGPHEEAARDADEQPTRGTASKTARKTARKPASKPAKKPARKPARSGAPRAEARKPADDQHTSDDRDRDRGDQRDDQRESQDSQDSQDSQESQRRRGRPRGTRLAVLAAEQLVDLTGKAFEGIVGLSKSEDGWSVSVEVLEMRRIPSTTDVIAVYEVDVDQDGDLTGYRRVHRFLRGEAGEDR